MQRILIIYHLPILSPSSTFYMNETIVQQQFTQITFTWWKMIHFFSAPLCTWVHVFRYCCILIYRHKNFYLWHHEWRHKKYLTRTILQRILILYCLRILSLASTFYMNETIVQQQFTQITFTWWKLFHFFSAPLCIRVHVFRYCCILINVKKLPFYNNV